MHAMRKEWKSMEINGKFKWGSWFLQGVYPKTILIERPDATIYDKDCD